MRIKVGIFFGGPSREREISFAGGRTVYDNLNKALFEPVPIFVDGRRNFVLLDWANLYKGSIRDFYPPVAALPPSPNGYQIYSESLGDISQATHHDLLSQVGRVLDPKSLAQTIDVAFLALHGEYGEDGQIQQQLQDLGIPYTGSGIRASQIGIDKALQKELMAEKGFAAPRIRVLDRATYLNDSIEGLHEKTVAEIGFPIVIRPANQGSSIGVSIVDERAGIEGFEGAVNRAFFRELVPLNEWQQRDEYDRREYVRLLGDLRDGLGFPLEVRLGTERLTIYHPEELLSWFNEHADANDEFAVADLRAFRAEERVILESFIEGKEFSCIVLRQEDGSVAALPPTEIVKGRELFDYRSKYLPGLSRKLTPIDLPEERIEAIRQECERLFTALDFQVYARIDGFHSEDGTIHLNDPNTTSGMLPSSFFFHQAAEIGLTPSQFLTYIIRMSLWERQAEQNDAYPAVASLLHALPTPSAGALPLSSEAILSSGTSRWRAGATYSKN
jgi:D-alanine-D-alanine ligase